MGVFKGLFPLSSFLLLFIPLFSANTEPILPSPKPIIGLFRKRYQKSSRAEKCISALHLSLSARECIECSSNEAGVHIEFPPMVERWTNAW